MKADSVRTHLLSAFDEVQAASQVTGQSELEQQLQGMAEILIVSEEPPRDPEGLVYPERGALDTIQRRLTTLIGETDDDAVVDHLERARRDLILVIATLQEQWERQHRQ